VAHPPRIRILFYNHTRLVSGAEHMLLLMLRVLDRERFEPTVACPIEGNGDLDTRVAAQGTPLIPAPPLQARFTSNPFKLAAYIRSFAAAILGFRRQILAHRPDLIHANSVRAGIVATIATTGTRIPVLWQVQDDLPNHPISSGIRLLAFLNRRTRFVAVSKATARAFMGSLHFGSRLNVLYNAIDLDRFPRKSSPLDSAAQSFRNELALAPSDLLVVSVGMIHTRKGLADLLTAFSLTKDRVPYDHFERSEKLSRDDAPTAAPQRLHLAIVGAPIFNDDHLHEAALKAQAHTLNLESRVHFTGPRSDVAAILRAADLLVLNASAEPFGLVLVEAMSSGTPVLATHVGGIPEIVTDNRTGFLVPPASPTLLAQRLEQLALSPASRAGVAEEAYRVVCPRFSIPVYTEALNALYDSLNLSPSPQ
jgi:glycosyltransferase involved in cell wall biosynthesis